MKFSDVPQITRANYQIDVPFDSLERTLEVYHKDHNLEMEPDFQRAHVWTEDQQIKYVEWVLRGGTSGRDILFNCPGWMRTFHGRMQLVDGLQRLTAVRRFLNNEIKVLGLYKKEFEGRLNFEASFRFYINDLETREQVLQWYLDINDGGTQHTNEEIEKVRKMLEKEKENGKVKNPR